MNTPSVSVLIPVYNVEKCLHRCLDSVINQTFTDFEVVLVDDGSTDGGAAICDDYTKKDSRIKVIHKSNGGLVSARKCGVENANGLYYVFLDSDDTLPIDALEILHREISNGYDVVRGCLLSINESTNTRLINHIVFHEGIITSNEQYVQYLYLGLTAPYLCGGIYKADLFNSSVFENIIKKNIGFSEDWITNLVIGKKVNKAKYITDVTYNYYSVSSSMVHTLVISNEYIDKVESVLWEENVNLYDTDGTILKAKHSANYLRSFFKPEIGFRYDKYKYVSKALADENARDLILQLVDRKYLKFIKVMPLYYLYCTIYCLAYKRFKLKGHQRRIV